MWGRRAGATWRTRAMNRSCRVRTKCDTEPRAGGSADTSSCSRSAFEPPRWNRPFQRRLVFLVLRDAVDGIFHVLAGIVGETVLHQEGVLAAVLVIRPQHAHCLESLSPEKQLRRQISFAHFQSDLCAAMAGKFADQLGHHLPAHPQAAKHRPDREIQDMKLGFVQFINHEADDFFALLGHHADAIALAQAAQKVLFGPCEFKAVLLGLENLRHVAADHPANVHADLLLLGSPCAHDFWLLPSPRRARPPPWERHASALVPYKTGSDLDGTGRMLVGAASSLRTPN